MCGLWQPAVRTTRTKSTMCFASQACSGDCWIAGLSRVTENMKLAAAKAIASVVQEDELNEYYIIPSVFNQSVAERVRDAVIEAAYEDGVARRRKEKVQT